MEKKEIKNAKEIAFLCNNAKCKYNGWDRFQSLTLQNTLQYFSNVQRSKHNMKKMVCYFPKENETNYEKLLPQLTRMDYSCEVT